jgi:hypothetical protein
VLLLRHSGGGGKRKNYGAHGVNKRIRITQYRDPIESYNEPKRKPARLLVVLLAQENLPVIRATTSEGDASASDLQNSPEIFPCQPKCGSTEEHGCTPPARRPLISLDFKRFYF